MAASRTTMPSAEAAPLPVSAVMLTWCVTTTSAPGPRQPESRARACAVGYPLQKHSYSGNVSSHRIGAAPCKARPFICTSTPVVHHHVPPHATSKAQPTRAYNPRHPERTLLYRTVAEHFETWLDLASAGQFDGQGDHHTPAPYVEKALRKYLECGIFAHCFARARCDDCGHDYLVAFSCKGRSVCPSCNTRRMAQAAMHLWPMVFNTP